MGNTKSNGREIQCCLCRVFNFKLACFCNGCNCMTYTSMPTSRVENSAKVLSCWLKFVHEHNIDKLQLKGLYLFQIFISRSGRISIQSITVQYSKTAQLIAVHLQARRTILISKDTTNRIVVHIKHIYKKISIIGDSIFVNSVNI